MAALQGGQSFAEFTLVRQCMSEIAPGEGVARFEVDGPAKAGDGVVELALRAIDDAQIIVGLRLFRIDLDGPEQGRQSLIRPILLQERAAQVRVPTRAVWI